MARIRFICPNINRCMLSSELGEDIYQTNLLPVRDDLFSDDGVLGCNGEVERSKTLALEMLTKYLQVLDSDSNLPMDVDISYPTWIAEKLMLQLLPEPLVSCVSDVGEVPIRPVKACSWFEDDRSTNDSTKYDSGGSLCPMVQEMELDVEDLPCKPTVQSTKLLIELSSPVDSGVDEDFKELKNCVLRQNCTRQENFHLALEVIHQQRGSTSVAAPSVEGIPWAVTAPPAPASTAPLEHLRTEELHIEKCLGSRGVKMVKKQPLVIVAANVTQPDGPVLPQRRRSYQRILALENEQLQVVERERHLPVDLILSPSTCLIVHTAATMKLNWEKNPSLVSKECSAFIVDIIVNCQMKAMSFSFEKCFMVFEGESAFISYILQATQTLAVAAAAFGMQVQCFVSGSPQSTEDIALMCIERIRKKAKRPYASLMSECENDDELFLEQFPSLNPLAAHAILSLNVPLSKFMLWSHNAMADALQDFEVPKESLKLFKLQSEHRKLMNGQGPKYIMRPKETHPDNFPFLPPTSSGYSDFETEFNDDLGRSDCRNLFCSSLDRIFEIDPLGDSPTSKEHIAFSPPFGPAFQLDPKFDEEFTSERCFDFWDDLYQLSEQEHLPVEPWPEEKPTQRPRTHRKSNRSQKHGYTQSSLDEWIEKIKRDRGDPNRSKQESGSAFLDLAKASIPSESRQQDLFPTLSFELHGREKVQSEAINIAPAKRAASALDLFRQQKGISRPLQKKLKPLSRPHLRSTVVDISSVQAARAHLSKRLCFKSVTNPSRFSRSS